jgi:hypothetical protein
MAIRGKLPNRPEFIVNVLSVIAKTDLFIKCLVLDLRQHLQHTHSMHTLLEKGMKTKTQQK